LYNITLILFFGVEFILVSARICFKDMPSVAFLSHLVLDMQLQSLAETPRASVLH